MKAWRDELGMDFRRTLPNYRPASSTGDLGGEQQHAIEPLELEQRDSVRHVPNTANTASRPRAGRHVAAGSRRAKRIRSASPRKTQKRPKTGSNPHRPLPHDLVDSQSSTPYYAEHDVEGKRARSSLAAGKGRAVQGPSA
eukprot:NODE_4497_length_800_cov_19.187750_g4159_i0.p1 GENE.NODE_4497_length_800_cov_19.187750_g4159_i0~~NODE_4497_length_800_cov_19.187750_g4159_i0.p1  ORF type:complete len:140 (+),score=4.85 NODE_4497_length_800_cov_19.187750_g4159_i0:148-567(+)